MLIAEHRENERVSGLCLCLRFCLCLYLRIGLCWASVTRQQQYLCLLLACASTSASASVRQQQQSFFDEFALLPNCATPTLCSALFYTLLALPLSRHPTLSSLFLPFNALTASVIIKCNEICLQWNPLSLILIWLRLCCCAVAAAAVAAAPTVSRLLCI